jgi:hypothetical protein
MLGPALEHLEMAKGQPGGPRCSPYKPRENWLFYSIMSGYTQQLLRWLTEISFSITVLLSLYKYTNLHIACLHAMFIGECQINQKVRRP